MSRKDTKIVWVCPKCKKETKVSISAYYPAKISGPPEHCYPAEGGEIEPGYCKWCGVVIDEDAANEQADEGEMNHADDEYDRRKDEELQQRRKEDS